MVDGAEVCMLGRNLTWNIHLEGAIGPLALFGSLNDARKDERCGSGGVLRATGTTLGEIHYLEPGQEAHE